MDNKNEQLPNSQNPDDQHSLTQPEIIQPINPASAPVTPTNPIEQPKIVVSQDVNTGQPSTSLDNMQPGLALPNSVEPKPAPIDQTPIGVSASQMGLEGFSFQLEWRKYVKKALITIGVVIVLIGGFTLLKNFISGTSTKTLSNGGYTYTFLFNRFSRSISTNGVNGFTTNNNFSVSATPVNIAVPLVCSELNYNWHPVFTSVGTNWQEAFSVKLYGSTHPVCTPDNKLYQVLFAAINSNHLFVVDYGSPQNSSVYPRLQSIFQSIKVSK